MSPETERELCHTLLTEILAYQFAWPVRWIETQDVLLNQYRAERFIEVGPQPILANMAKRTLQQNSDYENATTISTHREVYSVANDLDQICYNWVPPVQEQLPNAVGIPETIAAADNGETRSAQVSTIDYLPVAAKGQQQFEKEPSLTADLVLRFLVARKLIAFNLRSLPGEKSIKEACNGKSTLQNEIVGDISREFPSLQHVHHLEELSLNSISQELEAPSDLGPLTIDVVTKFIPRRFAGNLSKLSAVKEYLKRSWAVSNASALLLFMASRDLEKRLLNESETQLFIDKSCIEYAKMFNIPYTMADPAGVNSEINGNNVDDEKPKTVDIETYHNFEIELIQLHENQHRVMSTHLAVSDGKSEIEILKEKLKNMEGRLTDIENEFGSEFIDNSLKKSFSPLKMRTFDSAWNWAKQSILKLMYAALHEPQKITELMSPSTIQNIANRADLSVTRIIQHMLSCNEFEPAVKRKFETIIFICLKGMANPPSYCANQFKSQQPLSYNHVDTKGAQTKNASHYIKEMSVATAASSTEVSVISTKLNSDMSSYYKIEKELFQVYSKIIQYSLASNSSPSNIRSQFETVYEQLLIFLRNSDHVASFFRGIVNEAVRSVNKPLITTKYDELDVVVSDCEIFTSDDEDDELRPLEKRPSVPDITIPTGIVPFLHLKKRSNVSGGWNYDKCLTQRYLNSLLKISEDGMSFLNKRSLVLTVDAQDNLTLEVIRALLQAGSVVIVATQRYDSETNKVFQNCYQNFGATGSKLIILPLNISSKIDVSRFSEYLFSKIGDVDFFLPLHVKTTPGSILDYTSSAELAHRSSSVNLLRLLGNIVQQKRALGIETRPTHVLLPLSPNHANIYEKSNFRDTFMALVLQKWYDEDWSAELSICGCVYGWTNDDSDDLVAKGLEKLGVRPFTNSEMAFNMLGLLTYDVVLSSQDSPLIADLNGGLQTLPNLSSLVSDLKLQSKSDQELKAAIREQDSAERKLKGIIEKELKEVEPRGNVQLQFPQLLSYDLLTKNFNGDTLSGLLDLSQVVVVTGFAELGPWGSARTRWEMEKNGEFSLEGCIELATIMGLIEYVTSDKVTGWIDSKTHSSVQEYEIKDKYESQILEHCGIRIIEPALFQGYDPNKKQLLHEVVLTYDLSPIQVSSELASQYKLLHEDFVEIYPVPDTDSECLVKFLKGCNLMIPKALKFDRFVAGQIPTGWDPVRAGIPEDIVSQVDPVTLYALMATAEALISAGIKDPYEMYKYVHISQVGNCSGSGIGGMKSHREMQKVRLMDGNVQTDILPETFTNVTAAWINMLLLSSSGPIKTPVGACATAVESIDCAVETILSNKAKICIAGGYDDFEEHISHEFGNMGATSNSQKEVECGRDAKDMCRPATSTRNGFMESQGAGIQILMSAELAIDMGVPIYGIIGMASMASDKISKSLPAPGKGILTCARQLNTKQTIRNPKLDVRFRKRQLGNRLAEIKQWAETELSEGMDSDYVEQQAAKQEADAKKHWGNNFWHKDPRISPIKGCLATFGLTIDDIGVASCHGTSTKANEKNESAILNTIMEHLGRTDGNPVLTVFQKYLTGHPKGAAGAWMINGLLQIMQDGLVPGNRNADNIDEAFAEHKHLVYPSENIEMRTVKATCLTSFGFGQKGAVAVLINPNFVLAALSEHQYSEYAQKVNKRAVEAQYHFSDALINQKLCQVKDRPPFSALEEESVYLEPLARANGQLEIKSME
ncbi:LANO_0H07470g1_1 [Lachancea nothofagi CBS 11611]|uniref:Fatty acid synthase subunit alpha n=1 Tax=Lachancea nothofagi CBS 11611 TaxID=1266666 RepID=A0A1G4KLX3_9SACH|nr:LANO_0H07470g1_1 [Lachancea nothofagi CBS 11611]